VECFLRLKVPLSQYGLEPDNSLYEDLSACVLPQLPQSLLGHLGEARIVPRKTPDWHFTKKGVRLADGTDMDADVVIFCTGYEGNAKIKAILPDEERAVIFEPEGVLALYRFVFLTLLVLYHLLYRCRSTR
jgi:dimethylaniline monooxygenase (N-oxide forming)